MDTNIPALHQALKAYNDAVDRQKLVAHYLDRKFMGRSPTQLETAEVHARRLDKEAALRKICTFPCPDFSVLRAKVKALNTILSSGETLGAHQQRGLLQSILQMGKDVAVG